MRGLVRGRYYYVVKKINSYIVTFAEESNGMYIVNIINSTNKMYCTKKEVKLYLGETIEEARTKYPEKFI